MSHEDHPVQPADEAERRRREGLYQALAAATFEGIAFTREGRFVEVNEQFARMLGYAASEVIGLEVAALVVPEDRERVMANIRANRESVVEHQMVRKDGSLVTVEAHGKPLTHEGRPLRCTALRDVTQQRRGEAALRESEARYRTIVELAEEGIWTIDAQACTTFVNRKMASMLGYTVEEMTGRALSDFMDEEGRVIAARNVRRRQQGIAEQHEFRFRRKDGADLWTLVATNPIFDASGAYVGATALVTDITARRRIEQTLRQREALLTTLDQLSPVGVILWDEAFRVRSWNAAAQRIFGHSAEQALGQHATFIIPDDAKMYVDQVWQGLLAQSGGFRAANANVTRDGRRIECEWYNAPLADAQGRLTAVASFVEDVTERRRTEEALREAREQLERRVAERTAELRGANAALQASEERYRTLADASFEGILLSEHGRIIEANEQFARMFGYEVAEVVGREIVAFVAPESREQVLEGVRSGQDRVMQTTGLRKDGTCFTVEGHGRSVFRDGRALRITTLRDISERQRAERELGAFFELSPDMLCVAGFDGHFKRLNPAWERALGYSVEEILAHPWLHFVHPDDHAATVAEGRRLMKGASISRFENRYRCKDGSYRCMAWVAVPAAESNLIYAMARDVTDERQQRRERDQLQHDLRHAQRMEALGTLSAGVAHDLRNLLLAISGYSDISSRTLPADHPARQSLKLLEEVSAQARNVTDALLSFGERREMPPAPFNLRHAVAGALVVIRRLTPRAVALEEDSAAGEDLWINGQLTQIQRVLINLAVNARESMPVGGRIMIRLRPAAGQPDDAGRPFAELIVQDTGGGMTQETRRRMFEAYFTDSASGRGTGLGMTVVNDIVRHHGGRIEVESELGQGTRVVVRLPTCAPQTQTDSGVFMLPAAPDGAILVADGDQFARRIVASRLRLARQLVVEASDHAAAMQILKNPAAPIRLLIVSDQLAGGGRGDLVAGLRRVRAGLPVILLASAAPAEGLGKAAAGAAAPAPTTQANPLSEDLVVINKPFQVADLLRAAQNLLARPPRNPAP